MNIRQIHERDAVHLMRFYNHLDSDTIRVFRPLGEKTTLTVCMQVVAENYMEAPNRYDLLVEDKGRLIAWAFLADLQAVQPFLGIVVENAFQGRGLGKQLMEKMCMWSDQRQSPAIYLMVVKDNLRAKRLYTRFGFSVYADEFDEADQLHYWHMVRHLLPS